MVKFFQGAFKILDVNNSGSVKKQEMLSVIESMQEMLSNFTDIVSTENSPQSRVDKIYELLDKVCSLLNLFKLN
jgi:Ca2+-binding EF-hand superfamily protein